MRKHIETVNKNQLEVKNALSEMKNTLVGIKTRWVKKEDQISKLEDKV